MTDDLQATGDPAIVVFILKTQEGEYLVFPGTNDQSCFAVFTQPETAGSFVATLTERHSQIPISVGELRSAIQQSDATHVCTDPRSTADVGAYQTRTASDYLSEFTL